MQVSLFDKEKQNREEVIIPYQPIHKNDFVGEILVETLDLDERTINYFKKAGIFKINDLEGKDLLEIRGIGVNSKKRIETIIKQIYSDINIPKKEEGLSKIISYTNHKQSIFLSPSELKVISENLIEDLGLDIKTLNYLKKAGYIKINDLLEKDLTKVRGIREGSIRKIKQSIDFLVNNLNKYSSFDLKEFIENTLDERELDIIYDRFGFYGKEITLEEKGQALKVTRERIRQIQKKGITKLKRNIHLQCGNVKFLNYIFDSAQKNLNVSDLLHLPSEYNPKSVVKLLADMFPKDVFLYSNNTLTIDLITHPKSVGELDNLVNEIRNVLSNQTGFVEISELISYFKCDKKFIEKQKGVVSYNGLIGIKSNKMAMGDDKYHLVEQLLRSNPRPVHISEIMDKASMTEREVRSMIERMKRKSDVVNVGPSLFSLKEFGYKNLDTKHLIIDLLKEAGEPMSINNLIKSVQNRRVVKKTTILMALTNKDVFYKPIKGYVGLFEY